MTILAQTPACDNVVRDFHRRANELAPGSIVEVGTYPDGTLTYWVMSLELVVCGFSRVSIMDALDDFRAQLASKQEDIAL
jgi:hypothetical protein